MDNKDIAEKLTQIFPKYENLGKNIVQALKLLLDKNDIKYVSIYYRIKDLSSFLEKIERKDYEDPLTQIEDICGIRIICYYQSDIEKISKIISKEFDVIESDDKEEKLKADQFGYRSLHFIASIKKEWTQVPNYKGLEDLKTEIQVRTILMHAWAEIEHNLAYKSEAHTPDKFKRKLFRISAKLEEADEQFEDLKKESKAHQEKLLKGAKDNTFKFNSETPLNLDTLQAFLNYYFPKRKKNLEATSSLLEEIIKYKIKFGDLVLAYEKLNPHFDEIEKELLVNTKFSKFAQVGIVRVMMNIINDDYSKRYNNVAHKKYLDIRNKYYNYSIDNA